LLLQRSEGQVARNLDPAAQVHTTFHVIEDVLTGQHVDIITNSIMRPKSVLLLPIPACNSDVSAKMSTCHSKVRIIEGQPATGSAYFELPDKYAIADTAMADLTAVIAESCISDRNNSRKLGAFGGSGDSRGKSRSLVALLMPLIWAVGKLIAGFTRELKQKLCKRLRPGTSLRAPPD
jgi:hypothetical protein